MLQLASGEVTIEDRDPTRSRFRHVRRAAIRAEGHPAGEAQAARHDLHLVAVVVDDGALVAAQAVRRFRRLAVEGTLEAELIHYVKLAWSDGNDRRGTPQQRVTNRLDGCEGSRRRLVENLYVMTARPRAARYEESLSPRRRRVKAEA